MRFRSIGLKLTFWYTSVLTVTFVLLGTITYGVLAYSLSRDVDYAMSGVADVLVQNAHSAGNAFFPPDMDEIFRRFFGFSPLDRQVDIFDPRGRLEQQQRNRSNSIDIPLSKKALQSAADGISTFETIGDAEPYPIRVLTVPVIESGRVVNLVRVGMSLENMHRTRNRFLLIMGAVFPFGLLLAGGGGWLLARRALQPVARMTRTAQRISGEHSNQRLQESGNDDELDRLARTLNDMLGRLDGAIRQMRQFSADASHELQTPLTILKGEMEVALMQPRPPEEYQQVLKSGLEEIDRISLLVEGLLLLARADSGVLKLDAQVVNLRELVLETSNQMKAVADKKSIQLQTEQLDDLTTNGDPEHLRRLLLNLVDNAIKYSPENGIVRLFVQRKEEWAVISVQDTGIGLDAEEQQLVYNRFHRATEARSADGSGVGLGLSIALSIAEAHNGRLEVESSKGHGSTFRVLLPLI